MNKKGDTKMIIAVDLDATICTPISKADDDSEIRLQEILKGVREFIKEAQKRGNYIKIYTHRAFSLKVKTENWLKLKDIPYDEIIFDKEKYNLLIDDKALNFHNNWKRLLNKLPKLEKKYGKKT